MIQKNRKYLKTNSSAKRKKKQSKPHHILHRWVVVHCKPERVRLVFCVENDDISKIFKHYTQNWTWTNFSYSKNSAIHTLKKSLLLFLLMKILNYKTKKKEKTKNRGVSHGWYRCALLTFILLLERWRRFLYFFSSPVKFLP